MMRKVTRTVPAPAELGTEVIGVPEGSELELDLRLEAVMEGVLVSGTISAVAVGECIRCLDEVRLELAVPFSELYSYPENRVAEDQDEDRQEVEDELINLEPALRDAVVSELPFQPVCREDCPGLCSECGARLADDPDHSHEVADPRWSALQASCPMGCRTKHPVHPLWVPRTIRRRADGVAVPKRKMSRSNTRSRRAQWKATPTALTATTSGGTTTYSRPHQAKVVTDSAGTPLYLEYKGRKVKDL